VSPTPLERSLGVHRVLDPPGALPQAATRLDPDPRTGPDEVRVAVDLLDLDAATARELAAAHAGDGAAVRAAVLATVQHRGALTAVAGTPVRGTVVGVVDEVGPESPLGLRPGNRVAVLVPPAVVPLQVTDGLARWDGRSARVPTAGTAVLFGRSIAAVLPEDLPEDVVLVLLAVCGVPALTEQVVRRSGHRPSVAVLGAVGPAGSLGLAAARDARAGRLVGVVRDEQEAAELRAAGLADEVVVADLTDPLAVAAAVGPPVDVTVVCAPGAGAEPGAVLATTDGGAVVFFSPATSFPAAALSAEGTAADVVMLIASGYTPGHAALALDLYRRNAGVRSLVDPRVTR